MPSCLFTDPQVAQVGLTETAARQIGVAFEVAKVPTSSVLRTQTTGETAGFMKALIAPDDGRVLGFTMVGSEAGEVMAVVQMAMQSGLPYTALRDSILTHPTMAEGLNGLFSSVKRKPTAPIPGPTLHWPKNSHRKVTADGLTMFYRESGPSEAPWFCCCMDFPPRRFSSVS